MRFEKILVIGSGKIACDCVVHLATLVGAHQIFALESAENSVSMLKIFCLKNKILYEKILLKTKIENFIFDFVLKNKTLVVSANNRFIFTPKLIQMQNAQIINFHYALLPRYRGMNIPTWVVFNGEKKTGITWHFVTEKIDCGKIILQKEFAISKNATAFEIAKIGMALALEAFKEFIGELLEHPIAGREVFYGEHERVYKFSELPLDGIAPVKIDFDLLQKFLRAMDWGKMQVVTKPHLVLGKKCFSIEKYKIEEIGSAKNDNQKSGVFCVILNGKKITMNILECDKMTTKEILQKIGELKKCAGGGVLTNCFFSLACFPKEKKWNAFLNDKTVLFCKNEDGVNRLFFYTVCKQDFSEALAKNFFGKNCAIEITGKNPAQFEAELLAANFLCLEKQMRLSCNNAAFCFSPKSAAYKYKMSKDCFASFCDAKKIHKKLHKVFDTRVSHLQTLSEIKKSICKNEYSILKNSDSEIETLLLAKASAKSFYINEIFNFAQKAQIHGILKKRVFDYTQKGGSYIYAWVSQANAASQKFHAKYGLTHDGMWNCVYVKTAGGGGGIIEESL